MMAQGSRSLQQRSSGCLFVEWGSVDGGLRFVEDMFHEPAGFVGFGGWGFRATGRADDARMFPIWFVQSCCWMFPMLLEADGCRAWTQCRDSHGGRSWATQSGRRRLMRMARRRGELAVLAVLPSCHVVVLLVASQGSYSPLRGRRRLEAQVSCSLMAASLRGHSQGAAPSCTVRHFRAFHHGRAEDSNAAVDPRRSSTASTRCLAC